ncbi:MAG: TonB-dependent receptor [Agarilytica sp.]
MPDIFRGHHNSLTRIVSGLVCGLLTSAGSHALPAHQLFELSLEELMNVSIAGVGSLTRSSLKTTPAAVTQIDQEMILDSGARTLNELLDIYVPNVQWVRHIWLGNHIGARGVINNTDDKVMIRVNGRVMNERTHYGAVSERDFPTMSEIKNISVIRGAGSSLYGLGAVSMVIDIQTYTAKTLGKDKLVWRRGEIYEFDALEGQFKTEVAEDVGLYVYAGVAQVRGADGNDSEVVIGTDVVSAQTGDSVARGEALPGEDHYDGGQYRGRAPYKLHIQLSTSKSESWLRATRSGVQQIRHPSGRIISPEGSSTLGAPTLSGTEVGHLQYTVFHSQEFISNDEMEVSGVLSFDTQSFDRQNPSADPEAYANSHREDEWYLKLESVHHINDANEIAYGVEYSNERFGLKSYNSGRDTPRNARLGDMKPWTTNTYSLMGEWQKRWSSDWTSFVGGRMDKNTYTDVMASPRFALVWQMSENDSVKFIQARSQRMNAADDNRAAALADDDSTAPEKLDSTELRYERVKNDSRFAVDIFYIDLEAFGWDSTVERAVLVGQQKQWGFELEWERRWQSAELSFSHGYTKLLDFDLNGGSTLVTSEPFGFGNDLANWSNHISKIHGSYQLAEAWKLTTSLRYYWGFPGTQDYSRYRISNGSQQIDSDWEETFDDAIYLNFGLNYSAAKNTDVRLNVYNALGWIDKKYNKRLFVDSEGFYRAEAPALALSLDYSF